MLRLSEIMTREVVTVTPETTLREAVDLFSAKHISGAPVVSGHTVVGVVSASDILEFAASEPERFNEPPADASWADDASESDTERADAIPGSYYTDLFAGEGGDVADRIDAVSELSVLDLHAVDEVMTRDAISMSPNDTVLAAAEIMRRRAIHRILVIEDEKLVGILSTLDLARAVAEHKLSTKTYVFNKDRDFGPSRFPF